MAARQGDVAVAANTWTLLTDGAMTGNITVSSRYHYDIFFKPTTDGTTPTSMAGAVAYSPRMGETGKTIAELFPGLTSPDRLWGHAPLGGKISVSHA
jgi:hypothetical protein